MKKILYIVAPQNPEDIDNICKHAMLLSRRLQRKRLDEVQFGALILMNHPEAADGVAAVRNGTDAPTAFPPFFSNIKRFKRELTGYSYIFNTTHVSEDSIFNAYKMFSRQESHDGVDLGTTYQIVCFDFRSGAGRFLGNDSDLMVEDMSRNFRNRIGLHIFHRDCSSAYRNFSDGDRAGAYQNLISNRHSAGIMRNYPFEESKKIRANIDISIKEIIENI